MTIDLDRKGLESLVNGSNPYYSEFENPLVRKAGYDYSDQYGKTTWRSLDKLNDLELFKLYLVCRNSWG